MGTSTGAKSGKARFIIWTLLPVLLSSIALAIYHFAQPPALTTLKPKIFVLGLSKTGTTSIGDALERLGYRRLGWRDIRSRHMVHTWANGQRDSLVELTRYYDAFEDLPWPYMYRDMAERYPDAKFVLSVRKDEKTWMRSMETHVGRGRWLPYTYFYGADTFPGNERVILQSYRNHTQNVRAYFSDKSDRFMELTIDDGDINWDILCHVAQCPDGKVPAIAFPKANTAASWDLGAVGNKIQWLWGWAVTRTEEQASHYYYHNSPHQAIIRPVLGALWIAYDLVEKAYTEVYFDIISLVLPPLTADSVVGNDNAVH